MFLELNSDALLKVFDCSLFKYVVEMWKLSQVKISAEINLKKKKKRYRNCWDFFINILKFKFLF